MSILSFEDFKLNLNEINSFDAKNTYNHVYVYGVEDGKITDDGSGVMMFDTIANAQETFEELDPVKGSKNFSHAFDQHGLKGVLVFATINKLNQRNHYA